MCFKGPFLSKIIYSLNIKKTCQFTSKCVKVKDNNIQNSWKWKQIAVQDWLRKFRKRHGGLSLRKVESRSLKRTMVFNPRKNLKTLHNRPEVSLEMI